jgi:hypothetical protein
LVSESVSASGADKARNWNQAADLAALTIPIKVSSVGFESGLFRL